MGAPLSCSPPLSLPLSQPKVLSGTESAILNRESSDSESCGSNRAIPRSRRNILMGCDSDGDSKSTFRDYTLLYCDSTHVFAASHCGISGDSRPAVLGIVRFAIRASVPLSP